MHISVVDGREWRYPVVWVYALRPNAHHLRVADEFLLTESLWLVPGIYDWSK